jgi:hypothetical protein
MILLFFTFFGCGVLVNKLVLTDGNLEFLKGQNSINVEYQYDNLMVGEMTEEAYLEWQSEKKISVTQGKVINGLNNGLLIEKKNFNQNSKNYLMIILRGKPFLALVLRTLNLH